MSPELARLLLAAELVAIAALLVWAMRRLAGAKRQLTEIDAALERAIAVGCEQAQRIATLETLRDAQQTAEQALHAGGSLVREVHKGIASIPFGILESIPATRAPTRVVRDIHDRITDGVYEALGGLNKAVGRELRKGMKVEAPATAERPKPAEGSAPDDGKPG